MWLSSRIQEFRNSETWRFRNWFVQWKKNWMKILTAAACVLSCSVSSVENFCMNFESQVRFIEIYWLLISSVDLIKNWEDDWLILTDFITADCWKLDTSFELTVLMQSSSCLDESWKTMSAYKKLQNKKISDVLNQKLMILSSRWQLNYANLHESCKFCDFLK